MKIGLINPPAKFLMNERVFATLGILRVAAHLELNNHTVIFIDLAGKDNYDEIFKLKDCDFIGITSTTPQMPEVTKISKFIKTSLNKKIILGGPHVTMINAAVKKYNTPRAIKELNRLKSLFDIIICGDGEQAILKAIETKESFIDSEVDSSLYLKDSIYENLPFPARNLIDLSTYNYLIDGKRSTNLINQIGCPFSCNFCGGRDSKTFRSVRHRTVSSVIKEIDHLYKTYNYEGFMFFDDELNLNRKNFLDLLDALIEYQKLNKVSFNFRGFTRADLLDKEQADKMYQSGFRWVLTGFESGSDKMLTNMNKKTTVKQNTETCNIIRSSGLKIKALMSMGHPGESLETISETKDWLKLIKPEETDITIIATYPGSPYHDNTIWNSNKNAWEYTTINGEKLYSLDVDYSTDSVFYKTKTEEYKSYVFTDYLSQDQLIIERLKLEKSLI